MGMKPEDYIRLKESVAAAAEHRKEVRKREKYEPTEKQRKTEHLSDDQKKTFNELKLQMGSMIQKNTFIKSKREKDATTLTKKDMKKGGNRNQGSEGIHSVSFRNDVLKVSNQLIKYCVENHNITELRHIKPRMVEEFCRSKIENGDWTSTTLGTRISQLNKIGESSAKAGIKHHSRLITKNTREIKEAYPNKKEKRTRGKKKDGSGLTLREARTIAKHAGEQHGPMARVMVDILTEAGPRAAELMKLKWEHFDFENNVMDLTDKNMTKGGRPRIIEDMSPKTLQKLKDIYDSGLFPNSKQTIFRSHFHSEKVVRQVIEDGARAGQVANLAIHAFRNATKEYQTKNFQKELKKYQKEHGKEKGKKEFKDFMARKLMRYVSADEKLNPIINDETGERKFSYEKIVDQRVDKTIRDVVTQIFGHNRTDVLARY